MDPSYNNANYYTPTPTQEAAPTQQDYAKQQDYPPADSYQYPQQPQTQNYTQNPNNNLDELDRGCFQAYKIALCIAFLWRIYGLTSLVLILSNQGGFNFSFLLAFALGFYSMALIFLQFTAMKNRNLQKAKMALVGFIGYYFICIVHQIYNIVFFYRFSDSYFFAFQPLFWLALDIILTFIGSLKVYQFLNVNKIKCESDNSQSYYRA